MATSAVVHSRRTTRLDAVIRVSVDGRDLPLHEMREAGFDFHAARCWSLLVAFERYQARRIVVWREWPDGPDGRETLAVYNR